MKKWFVVIGLAGWLFGALTGYAVCSMRERKKSEAAESVKSLREMRVDLEFVKPLLMANPDFPEGRKRAITSAAGMADHVVALSYRPEVKATPEWKGMLAALRKVIEANPELEKEFFGPVFTTEQVSPFKELMDLAREGERGAARMAR